MSLINNESLLQSDDSVVEVSTAKTLTPFTLEELKEHASALSQEDKDALILHLEGSDEPLELEDEKLTLSDYIIGWTLMSVFALGLWKSVSLMIDLVKWSLF